jgi:hypothetical protein
MRRGPPGKITISGQCNLAMMQQRSCKEITSRGNKHPGLALTASSQGWHRPPRREEVMTQMRGRRKVTNGSRGGTVGSTQKLMKHGLLCVIVCDIKICELQVYASLSMPSVRCELHPRKVMNHRHRHRHKFNDEALVPRKVMNHRHRHKFNDEAMVLARATQLFLVVLLQQATRRKGKQVLMENRKQDSFNDFRR